MHPVTRPRFSRPPFSPSGDAGGGARWREALGIVDRLRGANIRGDASFYSTALSAIAGGCWEEGMRLLGQMREDHVKAETQLYNLVLDSSPP